MPKNTATETVTETVPTEVKVVYTTGRRDKSDQSLLEVMRENDLHDTQFVALANIVDCRPQLLYSKRNQKTGEYYYGRIADFIEDQYNAKNEVHLTASEIVEKAAEIIKEREASKRGKKSEDSVSKINRYVDKIEKLMADLSDEEKLEVQAMLQSI